MEIPRPETETVPQLQPTPQPQQRQICNPLSHSGNPHNDIVVCDAILHL